MSHPLEKFRFCPVCGSSHFVEHNFKSKQCQDCGFVYYANPCSATVAFILRTVTDPSSGKPRTELLVATRGKEPAKGTYDLVGGFVDMDETSEQGMRREITEETGIDAADLSIEYRFSIPNEYVYSDMVIHTLDMFYEVHIPADTPFRADDDVARLQWIPLSEVDYRLFGLHSISQGVKRFVANYSAAGQLITSRPAASQFPAKT
jgi:ADP-ribose pyrophosphatase YjhB (NUDIX family)